MSFRKLASVLGVAAALSLPAAVAQAQITTYAFQDDNIDFVLDPNTLQPRTSGAIAVGDVFLSVFEISSFSINGVPSIPAGQELTGIAAVQLQSISGSGVGAVYTFAPYSGGLNTFIPGADVNGGDAGGGAAIAMYFNPENLELDPTVFFGTNCTSLENCIAEATAGTLFQVDGFGEGSLWQATQNTPGGNDLETVLEDTSFATAVATVNALLTENFFNTEGGVIIPPMFLTGPIQGGSLAGTGSPHLTNGAVAHSDFDAVKRIVQVPEPGSLGLLGIALAGLGLIRRRRKS
ncbi:MAG TPA: PEP-CTERM sorting domain-containing protein [Bryobacteraceae bacterium]|nr:PEP-CTERM sorting domain-containing protein [Bryobacteraceae bacterium]